MAIPPTTTVPIQPVKVQPVQPTAAAPAAPPAPAPAAAIGPAAPKRTYKVAPKDTLYNIATKVYGRGNEQYYKLILEANRSTLSSAENLQVGQELVIPPLPPEATRVLDGRGLHDYLKDLTVVPPKAGAPSPVPAVPAPAGAPAPATSNLTPVAVAPKTLGLVKLDPSSSTPSPLVAKSAPLAPAAKTAASKTGKTYTVRQGDNLTSIARIQMKDGSNDAVKKLLEANRGTLGGSDRLDIGMVLTIPN